MFQGGPSRLLLECHLLEQIEAKFKKDILFLKVIFAFLETQ